MVASNCASIFYRFFYFAAAFFGIFGFKLFGAVDFMVAVPAFILLVLVANGAVIKIPVGFVLFSFSFVLLLILHFLVFNFGQNLENPNFILRLFRGTLSGLCLFSIFYYLSSRGHVVGAKNFHLLSFVFFICSLAVYIQAFVPSTQPFFGEIWGFDKSIRYLRAFGLSAGYDTIGYLLGWFSAVTFFVWLQFRKNVYIVLFLFFSLSVLFTSRTAMAVYLGLIFLTIVLSFRKFRFFSLKSAFIISVIFAIVYFLIFPIIYYSVISDEGSRIVMGVETASRFAVTDAEATASKHFSLPEDVHAILWGTGVDPQLDPGYTVAIHHGGIVSLFLYILFYILFFAFVFRKSKFEKNIYKYDERYRWVVVWRYSVFMMLSVIMIGNLKNLYFFTRGYHELFIIVAAIALGSASSLKKDPLIK